MLKKIVAIAVAFGAAVLQAQDLARQVDFNITPQPLAQAMLAFSEQTGIQIVTAGIDLSGHSTDGVSGRLAVSTALSRLLQGTRLSFKPVGETTLALFRENPTPRATPETSTTRSSIGGYVVDEASERALPGAAVRILETGQAATTDNLGRFRFADLAAGEYTLSISYIGYAEKHWRVGANNQGREAAYALQSAELDLSEVTIFGTRSARGRALNQQRTAENSSFVLSADTLGNFTGTTISEALRVAPGVAFKRDSVTGDGTNVILRGLAPDLNAVQINGLNLPTGLAEGGGLGRSANLSGLLADSVEKITINHSLLPSHDSAGSGGLVQIETKSPLQRPHRYLSFGVEGGRTQDADFQNDLLATGTISGTFGEARDFGLSASVQYRDREVRNITYSTQLAVGQYLPLDDNGELTVFGWDQIDPRRSFPFEPGVDTAYPYMVSNTTRDTKISTLAVTLAADWRVFGHTNLRLDVTRADSETENFSRQGAIEAFLGYDPMPVAALGGEVRNALSWGGGVRFSNTYATLMSHDVTDTYSFRVSTDIGKWQHGATLGYTAGRFTPDGLTLLTTTPEILPGVADLNTPEYLRPEAWDPTEGRVLSPYGRRTGRAMPLPLFTQAGFDYFNDADNHELGGGFLSQVAGRNRRYTLEASSRYAFDAPHLKYVELGTNFESARFTYLTNALSLDTSDVVCSPTDPTDCTLEKVSVGSVGLSFEDVDLSLIGVPRGQGFQVLQLRPFVSFFRNELSGGGDPRVELVPQPQDPRLALATTKENNLAAYLQARVDFGRLEIIGGARLSRVEVEAFNLQHSTFTDALGNPDFGFAERHTTLVNDSGVTTDVLPRMQFNYRQTPNLVFRGSYSLSIARPSVRELSSEKILTVDLQPLHGPVGGQPLLAISEGNPSLEPTVAHSFDLGAEYYSNQIGLMRLNVFYKHIENLLESNFRADVPIALEDLDLPDDPLLNDLPEDIVINVNQPVNNPDPARIWGLEGHVERQLTFLPGIWSGFGVYANLTYTDSAKRTEHTWFPGGVQEVLVFNSLPFEQQPKYTGTLALTYSKYNIDATLTYTAQSRRQAVLGFRAHGVDSYDESANSLDLRAERRFSSWGGEYRVYLEAQDLLKGGADPDLLGSIGAGATPLYYVHGSYLGGRLFRLGVNVNF